MIKPINLGYTGKPYDAVTGLYNYGYRDYKPEAARFTTADPIRDGTNWFAYVNNDPVNWVDPWGLEASDKSRSGFFDDQDKNAKYDTVQEMIDRLDSNSNKTVFIDAPYEPKAGDQVETALNGIETNRGTVLHPGNTADLNTVLNNGNFNGVNNIVVTGGHGSLNQPGQVGRLDFNNVSVNNGNLDGKNMYFPDCSLGAPESKEVLEKALGSDVNINAKDYNTSEYDVVRFLETAANRGQQHGEIDSAFDSIGKPGIRW
jgi:RHS repeat-associated protein